MMSLFARTTFKRSLVPISIRGGVSVKTLKQTRSFAVPASIKRPPGFESSPILQLQTLTLPTTATIRPTPENRQLAREMLDGIRSKSIIQFELNAPQKQLFTECLALSKAFFALPYSEKAKCVDDRSFAGYIASGEEITDQKKDYSEIFTVIKDLPLDDERVLANWPCHGPCPWPNEQFKIKMTELSESLGHSGEIILQLLALGLGLEINHFKKLTRDGWHHKRVLHFAPLNGAKDEEGQNRRGIGAHTDYGLLVLALSEPIHSVFFQNQDGEWKLLEQVPNTMTCFPGDMMQLLTNNYLLSTPHKVALNTGDRFAFAYFHEPNFNAVIEPLPQFDSVRQDLSASGRLNMEGRVHYGTHFTGKFMKNYSERITAKRIEKVGGLEILKKLETEAMKSI